MNTDFTVIVTMGVSSCGKTTIGKEISKVTDYPFYDGDNYHSIEAKQKMASGIPLNDNDRWPWLEEINNLIKQKLEQFKNKQLQKNKIILGCSSLKKSYRDKLVKNLEECKIVFVFLKGKYEVLLKRITEREHHFVKANLLKSQFETLEEPDVDKEQVVIVDINGSLENSVKQAVDGLKKYL